MSAPLIERRVNVDDAKLSMQRFVIYVLLIIFTAVTAYVFAGDNEAERSTIMQTVINFTLIAVSFALGSSKGSADKDASMSRIAEASAPTAAAAVAAAVATPLPTGPLKVEEVKIDAAVANVTEAPQPPKGTT